jgi:pimeloyl-ACP methyl ester carboxylesterase
VQRADIKGIQLEYQISGAGDSIVFIHGAFIADSFRPLLAEPALADRYKLITYRRRGYGSLKANFDTMPTTAAQQSADCAGLLRHLGIERAHVVGHSFGGCVALQLALDAPELVRSLALLEPALFVGASAQSYRNSLLQSRERYRVEGARAVMEEFLRARWPRYTRSGLEQVVSGGFDEALADAPTTFEMDIGLTNWTFDKDQAQLHLATSICCARWRQPKVASALPGDLPSAAGLAAACERPGRARCDSLLATRERRDIGHSRGRAG